MVQLSLHPSRTRAPQQDRAIRKVRKILRSAEKCYSTVGFEKTSMTHIAREAEVSTGTVYAYFADKDDVLMKLLQQHVEEVLKPAEAYMAKLKGTEKLESVLKKLIACSADIHTRHPGLHRVFLSRMMKDANLQVMALQYRDRGCAIGRELVRRFGGPRTKKDPEAAAQVVVGLLEFCTHIGLLYPSTVDYKRACRTGIDMIKSYFGVA